ncbi:MAG: rhomboid family intramembrane serine protease [Pseudomonadota bacterium]|nr:rhomboid family intramembrane serine protease [Pseudomonadota bacterium]
MLIIPHTADLNLARQPWATWAVAVLCLLIHIAQENSRDEVMVAAMGYCSDVFSDPVATDAVAWDNADECAWEMADLRSLPDPGLFIKHPENASKLFPSLEPEEIDKYFETLNTHYPSFALIAPPSLDARLMYDPTVPNPWRMITSALAHADWWHVIGNIIFFVAFAPLLELMAGRVRFISIMLLVTVVVHLTYSMTIACGGWPAPSLGLSGVVFGMTGLAAYVAPRVRIRTFIWFFFYVRNHSIPAWVLAGWFVGWNIWDMLTDDGYSGINFVAHVSGAFAGFFAGWLLMQKERKEYAEAIDEEIENQREKRADVLGTHTHSNIGNYRRIIEQKQMQAAEAEYESQMEDVYFSIKSGNDSTAILKLLEEYDLWSESPEVYEEVFNRMQQWGASRTLFCIGRLVIHLYAQKGLTAKAQLIASQCLALDPSFVLANLLDLGNMFRGSASVEAQDMARQLKLNVV